MADVVLSSEEAQDLALSIFEVLGHIEDGAELRDSWTSEMRGWCDLLLTRRDE